VTDNGLSIHKAAKLYGIPDSTLRDRFRGPYQPAPATDGANFNVSCGPSTTFSSLEERQLVEHSIYMASIGYGYARSEFMCLANDFAISLKIKSVADPPFAQSWFDGFKRRHPEITIAKAQKLNLLRARATSEPIIDQYFHDLKSVMDLYDLHSRPENIWNIDETGLMMEHTPSLVVCGSHTKPQAVTSHRGKTVTIIAAGNAVGSRLPPYFVFPGKRWNDQLLDGACPGASGTVTESGWSNSLVFMDFLKNHFRKHVPVSDSTSILLFDGHKSHVNLTLKEWGQENNIVFFVIPPHTSHVTQPLDIGCFGPLKRAYHSECQSFMRQTPGIQINRLNIAALSSKSYNKSLTPANLISSFAKAGIFPLDRLKITSAQTAPSTIYPSQTSSSSSQQEPENKTNFLEQKKITKAAVIGKKRNMPASIHGNIMSPSKESRLKRPNCETVNKQKNKSNQQNKKQKTNLPHPQPCTSAASSGGVPVEVPPYTDTDSTQGEEALDDSELCIVCHKFTPDAFTNAFTVEFIKWGQCDSCGGWVHLKYCTPISVLRRESTFLCPNCENES